MLKTTTVLAGLLAAAFASSAQAGTITLDFDELPIGAMASDVYPEVTFTTAHPNGMQVYGPGVVSGGNAIYPGAFQHDMTVTFTNPINDLTFQTSSDNHTDMADIDIYTDGTYAATIDLIGANGPNTTETQDLTAYTNITSIVIYGFRSDDGVGYDNFSFTPLETGLPSISAPAALGLILAGVLGLSARRR